MADQHTVIAPSAQCRQTGHRFLPVAVADSVAVWNEEACAECTQVYRMALDAGTSEEIAELFVKWARSHMAEEIAEQIADGLAHWAYPSNNEGEEENG